MEVKKFFRASRGLIGATRLYPLPSKVHIANAHKWIHTALNTTCPLPSIFLDPPLLGTSFHVTQFYQAFLHISTASDKRWGEEAWVRGCNLLAYSLNFQFPLKKKNLLCYVFHMKSAVCKPSG